MTNDSRKGWRYKLRHDRNQRKRRSSRIRARVYHFRTRSRVRRCASKSRTPHRGALQVHHVGGLASKRLAWFCAAHNQRDAGNHQRTFRRRQ